MNATSPTRLVDGRLVPAVGRWQVDPGHTLVGFEGRHLMISRIRGSFRRFSGWLEMAEIPEESQAELVVQAASVESGFRDRDVHLRSADWFDADRYPVIRFVGKQIRHLDHSRWQSSGELTIRGITRTVDVTIEFEGGTTDPWGSQKIGALITATINREDYGMTWNMPLATGGLVVSKDVQITIAVEAVRVASEQASQAAA